MVTRNNKFLRGFWENFIFTIADNFSTNRFSADNTNVYLGVVCARLFQREWGAEKSQIFRRLLLFICCSKENPALSAVFLYMPSLEGTWFPIKPRLVLESQILNAMTAHAPRCFGNGGHHQWVEHVLLTKGRLFSKAVWHIISLEWNLDNSPCPAVLHWLEDWIVLDPISQALLAKHFCDVVPVNLALLCISTFISWSLTLHLPSTDGTTLYHFITLPGQNHVGVSDLFIL